MADKDDNRVGLTTTIPVEVIFAAGKKALDLNNLFIKSPGSCERVEMAEHQGFSATVCTWIKGIYATIITEKIPQLVAVTQGDCSNTQALAELLTSEKCCQVITFEYPLNRQKKLLHGQIDKLVEKFNTSWNQVNQVKRDLDQIRKKLHHLDRLCWRDNLVIGEENHSWLVAASDFWGEPWEYEKKLDQFLAKAATRQPVRHKVRLGYIGVPPIFTNLYQTIQQMDVHLVYNEVQRQFSMPTTTENSNDVNMHDLVDQYLHYTYPYGTTGRLEDINRAIKERNIHGLIHYTQSFCHHQIEDIMLRRHLQIPIITLEGDRVTPVDQRTKNRLEAFIEMLRDKI